MADVSLILDALKKSEQQRQREKAPSLQSIHQPVTVAAKKTAQPWWLLGIVIVICNFAFFGYWFWRQQSIVSSAPQTSAVDSSTPAQQKPTIENSTSLAATAQAKSAQESQSEFTQISPHNAPVQAMPVDVAQREEVSELPESVRNNLPAMTFSFHVYSESPEQRTIIINDRRIREGDDISPGLRLQAITQDGVILLFDQHRIHIGVLTDW